MFETIMLGRRREPRIAVGIGRVLAFVLAVLPIPNRASAAPHLRVRGAAHIDAGATYTDGTLRIEGTLRDDSNVPLEEEAISVSLSASSGPPQDVFRVEACPRTKASRDPTGGISTVWSDEGGRFCVVASVPLSRRLLAHFAWSGRPLIDGTVLDLAVDPSLSSVELRFDPEPAVLSLEQESFGLDAVASFTDKATASSPTGLSLTLTNELGTELGQGITDTSGRVRFVLVSARAGPPGKGELRVTFAGNATTASALHVAPIERDARVWLSVPSAKGDTLPPGTPEEGVSLVVLAKTTSGEPVSSGTLEARIDGNPVGAAVLEHGRAALVVTFSAEAKTISAIQLRYEASAPGYEPADDVVLRLPVVGTTPWRRVPLVVAGLAVLVWLSLGRAARRPAPRLPATARRQASTSTSASVTVVRAREEAGAGWTGRVIDAHDAAPIGAAEVRILRAGVEPSEPLARATTDDAGRFELRFEERGEGDQLAVSSRLHATLRQRAPAFGEIEVALVLRRRALLDRLVAWAKARGAPFSDAREPTPGQVARAGAGDLRVEKWAGKVERAAFGPDEVDAEVERQIDEVAPPLPPGSAERLEKDVDDPPR
jgi:hypothetical protein